MPGQRPILVLHHPLPLHFRVSYRRHARSGSGAYACRSSSSDLPRVLRLISKRFSRRRLGTSLFSLRTICRSTASSRLSIASTSLATSGAHTNRIRASQPFACFPVNVADRSRSSYASFFCPNDETSVTTPPPFVASAVSPPAAAPAVAAAAAAGASILLPHFNSVSCTPAAPRRGVTTQNISYKGAMLVATTNPLAPSLPPSAALSLSPSLPLYFQDLKYWCTLQIVHLRSLTSQSLPES